MQYWLRAKAVRGGQPEPWSDQVTRTADIQVCSRRFRVWIRRAAEGTKSFFYVAAINGTGESRLIRTL